MAPTVRQGKAYKPVLKTSEIGRVLLNLVIRCKRCKDVVRASDRTVHFSALMAVVAQVQDAWADEEMNQARQEREDQARPELAAARAMIAPVAQEIARLEE